MVRRTKPPLGALFASPLCHGALPPLGSVTEAPGPGARGLFGNYKHGSAPPAQLETTAWSCSQNGLPHPSWIFGLAFSTLLMRLPRCLHYNHLGRVGSAASQHSEKLYKREMGGVGQMRAWAVPVLGDVL